MCLWLVVWTAERNITGLVLSGLGIQHLLMGRVPRMFQWFWAVLGISSIGIGWGCDRPETIKLSHHSCDPFINGQQMCMSVLSAEYTSNILYQLPELVWPSQLLLGDPPWTSPIAQQLKLTPRFIRGLQDLVSMQRIALVLVNQCLVYAIWKCFEWNTHTHVCVCSEEWGNVGRI